MTIVLAATSFTALTGVAQAYTYTVGLTTDPDNGLCASTTATCSLRQIINQVDAHPFPPDTINVPPGTYTLSYGSSLNITQGLSIVGAGPRSTVISMPVPPIFTDRGTQGDRVINITGSPTVSISRVEITGGDALPPPQNPAYFGGDIASTGNLTLTDDWITNGSAWSGGGVANQGGTLIVERSLISNNSALFGGGDSGAIQNYEVPGTPDLPAHLIVDNSTIANNNARLVGGIFSWSGDPGNPQDNTLSITNSTIVGNASEDGPVLPLRPSGGGLGVSDGTENVQNSIIAGNVNITGNFMTPPGTATPTNCGPFSPSFINSLGHNLDSGSDCFFTGPGDLSNANPLLGPLQNNGGPTDTLALASNSPAVDAVPVSANCPSNDQRGVLRPQGSACDIGAFEVLSPPLATSQSATAVTESTAVLHGTVRRNGDAIRTYFQYSKKSTLSGARSTPTQTVSGIGPAGLSAILTGLPAKTRFYYRFVATDGLTGAMSFGAILRFTTAAPPPRISSTMTWDIPKHRTYAVIQLLVVNDVLIGATVKVSCRGRSCPYKSRTVFARKPKHRKHHRTPTVITVDLSRPFRGRHLPYSTQVTIRILKRGYVGKVYAFKLKHGIQPEIGCIAPGGSTPGQNC